MTAARLYIRRLGGSPVPMVRTAEQVRAMTPVAPIPTTMAERHAYRAAQDALSARMVAARIARRHRAVRSAPLVRTGYGVSVPSPSGAWWTARTFPTGGPAERYAAACGGRVILVRP